MNMVHRSLLAFVFCLTAVASIATAGNAQADIHDFTADLRPSVTVTGPVVTLGDLFEGDIMRPEKAVAKAPEPGQRFVLGAKWLSDLARTYGIDWRPSNTYDRATVYREGQTISQSDILDHLRGELALHGLPSNYGLEVVTPLSSVTVSTDVAPEIGIREPYFDEESRVFSAVIEVPRGAPSAQFIPVRGLVFPTVTVPTLKQNISKNTLITDDMITLVDIKADNVYRDTIMDPRLLVGKSPRTYIRSGEPVRDTDVIRVSLVDIPVPVQNLREDAKITTAHLHWVTVNQSDLSDNVITDMNRLIGLSPRRFLPSGAPIRSSDVHSVVPVEIPVAIRDIRRGTLVTDRDYHWVTVNEHEINGDVLYDDYDIEGLVARRTVRAGQAFRDRDLRTPIVVDRGKIVTIKLNTPYMQLSAKGKALEKGGAHETIKVVNTLSNKTILATIVDADTVRVDSLQTAMQ
ncbi:MAG: flagellar basal body P-ring formation chaperone FlgA [Rhodospirillaceae bacterium]